MYPSLIQRHCVPLLNPVSLSPFLEVITILNWVNGSTYRQNPNWLNRKEYEQGKVLCLNSK